MLETVWVCEDRISGRIPSHLVVIAKVAVVTGAVWIAAVPVRIVCAHVMAGKADCLAVDRTNGGCFG